MEWLITVYLYILAMELLVLIISLSYQALFGEKSSYDGTIPGTGMKFGWKLILLLLAIPAIAVILIEFVILPMARKGN